MTRASHISDQQIYIVVDIEADGPVPGQYSMLSLAAVATTPELEIGRFYRKLQALPGAGQEPNTMRWWNTEPKAWEEVQTGAEDPSVVISDFVAWIESLDKQPIFVASPIALDYSFVGWYLMRFAGRNPFSNEHNAVRTLDIRSFISGKYGLTFDGSSRTQLPDRLTHVMPPHTHKAIDDAVGYANLLRHVLRIDALTPPPENEEK
jgi:hypothetical protein